MRPSWPKISKCTRALVLERDKFTCQMCGATAGEPDDYGGKTRIQVGRILARLTEGSDDALNLRAICSVCNAGLRILTLDRPSLQKLLIQVRRATGGDQVEVLRWLIQKFPKQTATILAEITKK